MSVAKGTGAATYYTELLALTQSADSERPEIKQAKAYLGQ